MYIFRICDKNICKGLILVENLDESWDSTLYRHSINGSNGESTVEDFTNYYDFKVFQGYINRHFGRIGELNQFTVTYKESTGLMECPNYEFPWYLPPNAAIFINNCLHVFKEEANTIVAYIKEYFIIDKSVTVKIYNKTELKDPEEYNIFDERFDIK